MQQEHAIGILLTFQQVSGLIAGMKQPSNVWENGPWPGKQRD